MSRCSCRVSGFGYRVLGFVNPDTRHPKPDTRSAIRLIVPDELIAFSDVLHGERSINVQRQVGDFIVATKAGLAAYQLAVVVDDARQQVSEVVRGDDLLSSTPRQIALYRALGRPVPSFAHVGLVLDADGQRMATRDGATSIASLRKAGRSAEELIGELACSLGLTESSAPIRAEELISSFELNKVRRSPFTWKSKG